MNIKRASLVFKASSEKDTVLIISPNEKLDGVTAFHAEHGHPNVPLGSELGRWVYLQRRLKAEGRIDAIVEEALDGMGVTWKLEPETFDWQEMSGRLLAYRAANGDALVPKKYVEDPLLGAWVAWCRRQRLLLPPERRAELEAAEFQWLPTATCGSSFMINFRAYVTAKEARVSVDEKWCDAMREARKKGKLSETRIEYLDGAKFDWGGA
eukprot:CAMPEP_0172592352 /NCGR_PEP_ID=MMETSP1068-20121228/11315_1 /TAXON_ID=35684 /ORGANISM="Pseudopedinella elastica, Strain CCMP716" /LENGTH=209 /DNA_ID=CAMNT_0013389311 /DNA_START=34 /DNA_END=663 /DNA_ORIENTATION=+